VTPDPRIVAEDAQAYLPSRRSTIRLDADDVALRHHPHSPEAFFGSATRPRFAEATVERRVAEVREWFRAAGRADFVWMIGDSATPTSLVDRLLELGASFSDDPDGSAMIIDVPPPPAPPGIDIRRVSTFADYEAAMRIIFEDATDEAWQETAAGLAAAWDEARDDQRMYMFLAVEQGAPIGFAQLVWLTNGLPYLGGAGTVKAARGRGAFRALVRARWDDAAARGHPVLLVQAGRMSSPILTGLGFRTVGTVRTLVDSSGLRSPR
jgi:hypothetical protein